MILSAQLFVQDNCCLLSTPVGGDSIMRTLYPMWEFQWGKAEGLFACILHMNLSTMRYNKLLLLSHVNPLTHSLTKDKSKRFQL